MPYDDPILLVMSESKEKKSKSSKEYVISLNLQKKGMFGSSTGFCLGLNLILFTLADLIEEILCMYLA